MVRRPSQPRPVAVSKNADRSCRGPSEMLERGGFPFGFAYLLIVWSWVKVT